MSISITEILATDEVSSSRLTINNNMNALANEVNALLEHVSTTDGTSTITSLTIQKSESESVTAVGLDLQKSANIAGNVSVSETLTSKLLSVSNGITASGGDITQANSANKISAANLSVAGSVIQSGFTNSFTPAYNRSSYATYSGTTGNLITTKKSVILLQWTAAYDPANTADGFDIKDVKLPASADAGQRITICTKLDNDVTSTAGHFLIPPTGGTIVGVASGHGILLSNNSTAVGSNLYYSCVELAWTGAEWLIINLYGASIESLS